MQQMARKLKTPALTMATLALLLMLASVAFGHPLSDQDQIMHTVLRWADGYTNGDPHLVAPILHESFRAIEQDSTGRVLNRESYLKLLGSEGDPHIRVTLRYAFHEAGDNEATVRPVVTYWDDLLFALAFKLTKVGDEWQITEIAPDADLPQELLRSLPEQFELQRVWGCTLRMPPPGSRLRSG
jgi:hypothetical protein